MGNRKRAKKKRAARSAKRKQARSRGGATLPVVQFQMPRPNTTTFASITVVPSFPLGHPLGSSDLPPEGSLGRYAVDAVLGIPGASRSAFTDLNWDRIAAEGDSLIELPKGTTSITQKWQRGGPDGEQVIAYDFSLNADHRLANATTQLYADGFKAALVDTQDVLESYLSALSFHHDVLIEAVAWRITEERTGAVRLAMKHLGKVKQFDPKFTLLSTPELRELLSTWREAMNADTPMGQALSFYKLIERVHKYRIDRGARTENQYLRPREIIPDQIGSFISEYEWGSELFKPFLGKKFTIVWEKDLRERIRNAVAHLREDAPSLTADRAADVETCRQVVPVLHYMARMMIQREISDQEQWPMPETPPPAADS